MADQTELYQQMQGTPKSAAAPAAHRRLFGPPTVPTTPSKSINSMLNKHCGEPHQSPLKAAMAYYICYMMKAIQIVYTNLNRGAVSSQPMWIASCAIIAFLYIVLSYVSYYVVVLALYMLHYVLYYAVILMSFVGVGLSVSAAVFYGKDTTPQTSKLGESDPDNNAMSHEQKTKYY